ncbi:DnaA ATPase domain-containing protein [Streptococcus loxodontisalivarius]|uniref:Chromosomal replication initiation ATPase DnaA n=1 Tax=Streptococcus loxodontisalivarius TaxID=1349415 RepID=A0ABS2PSW5_9STRE|nr:DnaA/Hda family protein [Streptococcus loxodontisalivarius]MBM7642805.1 chromosomal replication initiation ATPase DnaA [Streptococcus loxodontisalivarius]
MTKTLDDIVRDDKNALALAGLKMVCEEKGIYNPLYLYGEEESMKNELVQATYEKLGLQKGVQVALCSAYVLTIEKISEIVSSALDYLILTDLDQLTFDTENEQALIELINAPGKQVIVTAQVEPSQLPIGIDLETALTSGMTVSL